MQANELLAKSLGLSAEEITTETTLESCANWDSLAHLRLILAIEETLGRALEPTEIFEISGFTDVERLLKT